MLLWVLLFLFLEGCWLYCLVDAALTPAEEYRGLPKTRWIGIIVATFIVGAIAWLVARRRSGWSRSWVADPARHLTLASMDDLTWYPGTAPDGAIARHPAGRSRQAGLTEVCCPDDDPEFLRLLDSRIRGTSTDAGD